MTRPLHIEAIASPALEARLQYPYCAGRILRIPAFALEDQAAAMLGGDRGMGLGAVIAAEIGDITRFARPGQLCSWAGLTPRHHESDLKVIRGHASKQGSRTLRWAVVEAIQRQPAGTRPWQVKYAITARRGARPAASQNRRRADPADPGVLLAARRVYPPRRQPGSVNCSARAPETL